MVNANGAYIDFYLCWNRYEGEDDLYTFIITV